MFKFIHLINVDTTDTELHWAVASSKINMNIRNPRGGAFFRLQQCIFGLTIENY